MLDKVEYRKSNTMKTTEQKTIELFSHAVLDNPNPNSTQSEFHISSALLLILASFIIWIGMSFMAKAIGETSGAIMGKLFLP